MGYALTDHLHHARAFQAESTRQRQRIKAGTMISVDEIQPDRSIADSRLAFSRIADRNVFVHQYFGPACLVKSHRFGHGSLLKFF